MMPTRNDSLIESIDRGAIEDNGHELDIKNQSHEAISVCSGTNDSDLIEPFRPQRRQQKRGLTSLFSRITRFSQQNKSTDKWYDSDTSITLEEGLNTSSNNKSSLKDSSTSTFLGKHKKKIKKSLNKMYKNDYENNSTSYSSTQTTSEEEQKYQEKIHSVLSNDESFRKLKEDMRKKHRTGFASQQSIYNHVLKQQSKLSNFDTNTIIHERKDRGEMPMSAEEKLFLQNSTSFRGGGISTDVTNNSSFGKLGIPREEKDNRRKLFGRRRSMGEKSPSFIFRISRRSSCQRED